MDLHSAEAISKKSDTKLLLTILVLGIVVLTRLSYIAYLDANWRGLAYSGLHVLVVAVGSYFALRDAV